MYDRRGYHVETTSVSGDFGVDVIAEKNGKRTVIQAKRYTENIGVKAIQEVAAGAFFYKADDAVVITSSFFTEQAKMLAHSTGVELVDRNHLIKMWTAVHKNEDIPAFDLQEYEKIRFPNRPHPRKKVNRRTEANVKIGVRGEWC